MFRKMCIVAPTPVCRFRGPLTPLGPFAIFPRLFDAPRMYQREPISVTEEADKVLFELELPRFRPEDVKFTVDKERGVVGVRGQRKDANGEVQAQFERSFSVSPRWLDLAGCETKVEHGVATLTIPKKRAGEKKESEAAIKPQESKSTEQATATESNKAASTAVTEPSVPRSETQVKPASEDSATTVGADSYKAVRSMSWPPRFETEDSEREIVYTCDLPSAVQPDNVDVSLERGYLSVGIRSTLDSVQKDSKGNVVFQNTRSVHYSTALGVPRGTGEDDVAVQLKEGKLRIAVKKHDESSEKRSSSIKVSSE